MIDIKAVKESNKLRVYAKIPNKSSEQAKNKNVPVRKIKVDGKWVEDDNLSKKIAKQFEGQFSGDYVGFYNQHRAPGLDPEFKGGDTYEKVFEAYTNLGDGFNLDFNGFSTESQLVDFSPGSFGMGLINVLSTVGNFMPTLDIPLMQTYTGVKNLKIPVKCYIDLEDWKERNAEYIEQNSLTAMGIVNYCYNYPILRLLSLVLPYRNAKFGTSFDKYTTGNKIGERALKTAYIKDKDGKIFDAEKFVDNLEKDPELSNNSFIGGLRENLKNYYGKDGKKADLNTLSESDIRSYLANPLNYTENELAGNSDPNNKDAGDIYWLSMGIVSAEITDTEHGSDNTLVQLLKYVGKGINWILEQGKGAIDTFIGDIYYLRPPFPYQKVADTGQKGFTILYGSKRFDDVVLTGVKIEIPSGYYEGAVPSSISITIDFMTRRMPTINMFEGLLMKNDPMVRFGKDGHGYDNTIEVKTGENSDWKLPETNTSENSYNNQNDIAGKVPNTYGQVGTVTDFEDTNEDLGGGDSTNDDTNLYNIPELVKQ